MNIQPTLENELIILRPLITSDFELLYNVAKDPLIWEQHPSSNRYKKDVYSEYFEDSINSKGAFVIINKSNNEIIGSTRFKPVYDVSTAIEIGWSFLSRKYWGGTYNKSFKKLMIDYAFESIEDIVFYIEKPNTRSQKAVEKLGGTKIIETIYQHLMYKGENAFTYRINKNAWNSINKNELNFNPFPEIATQRLLLRRLLQTDWKEISYLRTDAIVNQFVIRPKAENKEEALKFINRINNNIDNNECLQWSINLKDNTETIGTISLWNFSEDLKTAEVGYDLNPKYHNLGIMSEALKNVLYFGFYTLKFNSIEAYTQLNNESSKRLLLKNGFILNKNRSDENNIKNIIFEIKK